MDNVVLSIDGRKEVNDRMRPFRKGAGSYDLIVPKFQKLAESRNQERYYVRGTYTHFNTDFSKDVLQVSGTSERSGHSFTPPSGTDAYGHSLLFFQQY